VWFAEATAAGAAQPEAMALATATPDGWPSARMVLLKGFDERGFVFHTNYQSRKGREMAENPRAAAVLYWVELHRQVRIEGCVETISAAESDAYFRTRARGSQLGALASNQSRVIESRALLERRARELAAGYEGRAIPRPAHWGGYRLRPETLEFWQGQPDRLHDRLRYSRRPDGTWLLERLEP